jgi:tripartite ATP-independent transporter DctM subunit
MFLGGMLPTLLLVGILATWGIMHQPVRRGVQAPFEWGKVRDALVAAKWELSVPIVPIISLSTGFATPVEAAALTALYVFFLTVFVHHDLRLANDVPRVITECGLIIGGIMLIMGVALGLTDFLVDAQIPDHMVTWVTHTIRSQFIFLLVLNASLLIAGCVIEIYPAIMILAPIVTRIGQAYGLDPVHLGIIFLANMELGYLTPLVGLNLFYASYRFGKPIIQIFRAVAPLFLWLGVGVLVITYIPWFSTGLFTLLH